jgi:glycosyltransferase involved in cell wall biosynthesis
MTPAFAGITGIARYSRMLWDRLDQRHDVHARGFAVGRKQNWRHVNLIRIPLPVRVMQPLWRTGRPRVETLLGDVDVFHCIDLIPAPTRKPLVITWHDTFRLPGPEYHSPAALQARTARIAMLAKASVVLTYCEATKRELVEATGYPEDRVMLSAPGFDIPDEPAGKVPVDGPFILAAGALTPRKGFDVLAAAVARLGPEAPPLVIAGPDGWGADVVKRSIAAALPSDRYILLGERYGDIASLYRQATVVAHPSLAEGFGYVCLEAMGAGAAVVAADIPSIREMGEGCVRLVPAGDPDSLADAIASLLADPDERERLGRLGKQQASTYTWDRMADQTVRAYMRAAGH